MVKAAAFASAVIVALSFSVAPVQTASAAIDAAKDGKTKINLSGRQRMLSQRMAKAACFASMDVQATEHMTMLGDAHALFQQTLEGLSAGDSDQGMLPENNGEILSNLGEVESLWSGYRVVNEEILASNAVSDEQLATIATINLPVLEQMHKTVGVIEKVYGSSGEVHPALALALNVSGRQRMLSQKASKEFCLIAAGVDVDANRASLAKTVELFSTSLTGLINGDAANALAPAPTPDILAQLQKVQAMWAPLESAFQSVISGQAPSDSEIALVAKDNNPLLVEMNKAVFMYNAL